MDTMGKKVVWAIVIAFLAWFLWTLWYRQTDQGRAEAYINEMNKLYADDTYGGSTPEETIQLFIAALEKGDVELAAKYFLPGEQSDWLLKLSILEKGDLIKKLIEDLGSLGEKYPLTPDNTSFFFETKNENNELTLQLNIAKSERGLWKIVSM